MKEQSETFQDAIKHCFFFLNDYIKSLLDQIEHLKSEVSFLRRELKDKNAFAKTNFNPGSDNKNQQNVYGNQDRKLSVTTNESSTLPKKGKTSSNNKNNNRGNTKKTVLKHNEENNNKNDKKK